MTNSEIWKTYVNFTIDLSNNLRKLGFASIAIAYILNNSCTDFSVILKISILFTILFFLCDIMQYFAGAIRKRISITKQEKIYKRDTKSIEGEYIINRKEDTPSFLLWVFKTIFIVISYLILIISII